MLPDLEPFFGRWRVLLPDTRGHGLSEKFERVEDYTYGKKAGDVLLWLDAPGAGARGHLHQRPAGRFEEYFDANIRLRMGEDWLERLRARPERYAELTGRLREHSVAPLLALLDETYSRSEWLADCARIRCPVQVIAGSEDHFPTVAMSRRVAETIPGARLHVVAGGSHFPNRSHRAEVQAVIAAFLGTLGPLTVLPSAHLREGRRA